MAKYRKKKCSVCKTKDAEWLYEPMGDRKNFFCDDCVPRGCTCNIDFLEYGEPLDNKNLIYYTKEDLKDGYPDDNVGSKERKEDSIAYEELDDKGRKEPCQEYSYLGKDEWKFKDNVYGFYKEELTHLIHNAYFDKLPSSLKEKIEELLEEVEYRDYPNPINDDVVSKECVDYNVVRPDLNRLYRNFKFSLIGKDYDRESFRKYWNKLFYQMRTEKRLIQDNILC